MLAPGSRVGPYEIVSPLGAGGMGEVFRARDLRLKRDVALKVLPTELTRDPERLQRFQQEAEAAAALSHPHICTLHDVGEHAGTSFLVMELVDGETLAARLERGPLALTEAVAIAMQVADALDAAHRRGIVHRDVKPANIMLAKTGAKLLDFGLAKLRGSPPVAGFAGAATQTALTSQGAILGSLNYMAPEQVEGTEIDARTDVFALGCVLHEMVTGRRAFDGASAASVMAAILERPAPRASAARQSVPAHLDHVIAKCLAKAPDDRWQSARDVFTELRWLREQPRNETSAVVAQPRVRRRLVLATVGFALAAALGAGGFDLGRRVSAPATPFTQLPIRFGAGIPGGTNLVSSRLVAISDEGRRIAFVGTRSRQLPLVDDGSTDTGTQLFVQSLDQPAAVALAGTAGATGPFFSPDGQWLAFSQGLSLRKMPIAGGASQLICPTGPGGHRGAAWLANDVIIFAPGGTSGGLARVSANGGKPEDLVAADPSRGERDLRWPTLLPDGDTLLFAVSRAGRVGDSRIDSFSLASRVRRRIVESGSNPRYLSSGHLVYANEARLWVVPFDATSQQATGTPVALVENLATAASSAGHFDIAANGTLVYLSPATPDSDTGYPLLWVDRNGATPSKLQPRSYGDVRIAPDGSRVAYSQRGDGFADVWIHDLSRGHNTRFTTDPGEEETPIWSPDSRQIAFAASRVGERRTVYIRNADGSGQDRAVWVTDVHMHLYAWSPDGETLVAVISGNAAENAIMLIPAAGGEAKPYLRTEFSEGQPAISPDGKWLAYQSNESGQAEVYVQPFPEAGAKIQVSTDGGFQPVWTRDGRRLVYRSSNRFYQAEVIRTGSRIAFGGPRELAADPTTGTGHYNYDVAPDGRLLVVGVPRDEFLLPSLLFNTHDEIRRRFATR